MKSVGTLLASATLLVTLTGCAFVGDYPIGSMYAPAPYNYNYSAYGNYSNPIPRPYQLAHFNGGGSGWNRSKDNWGGNHNEYHERTHH